MRFKLFYVLLLVFHKYLDVYIEPAPSNWATDAAGSNSNLN
jgi:hypothetical protein